MTENPTTPQNSTPRDVLDAINRRMAALSLGECAIVSHRQEGSYLAYLYLAATFRESETVAGWFHALGATAVVIAHTLYSDEDDNRDGLTHGRQAWTVYFDLPHTAAAGEGA
jgi:hypothetical protein